MAPPIPVPRIAGEYVTVYRPQEDVYPGPDTAELVAGATYPVWAPNDHTVLRGPDGSWHAFGITHPLTSPAHIHDGEFLSFHARSPQGSLRSVLRDGLWQDLPKVLPPCARPGERLENHAPFIVHHAGQYHMLYGPSPIRRAVSDDLMTWVPTGPLFLEPRGARDPCVLSWGGFYHLVFCTLEEVRLRVSRDLRTWSESTTILRMPQGIAPESPVLVRHAHTFYLFVCGWDGVWDHHGVTGAYQHLTYVYQSNRPDLFGDAPIAQLDSHAPEVFQDEADDWFISSAEWPARGVSIAPLAWDIDQA